MSITSNYSLTIGTRNGPRVPATAIDCDDPDSAIRADIAGGQEEVKSISSGLLASVSAARTAFVGDEQELRIL